MKESCLFLVATPIGNLSDITLRALETLKTVDVIAAEDTRVTRKLLAHFDIHTPLVSYHEHNRNTAGEALLARLKSGESVALVTDAGTPAISDPGEDLVRRCLDLHIPVTSIPGACAAICALTVSGRDTRRFVFEGFLPEKKAQRRDVLLSLKHEWRTAILYESPHRLSDTLSALAEELGDRPISVCREMTKLNEEVFRGTVREALDHFGKTGVRGEFVLVLQGAEPLDAPFWQSLSVEEHFDTYVRQGYSKKDAIRLVAADRGVKKNEIYMHFVEKDT